ncbi:elongation factor G [Candidatus Collierbacteria bacterium CG10_big_fil_rev_8_21_14_0_10_44_9]|uniref:Elongation factor G n=1 Tax=Candidatus Collierbacteria bacterium CG10_big_fil_rev_8_21_14_0_10_44_9 TaxID=1974535 RepID=A0A2H0VL09_9BACT|nr:MAG: elongation factor G [Candidatus Collierbacteria bacterium CG10_big_fil_rev_8_21_14_0_10_44_9]
MAIVKTKNRELPMDKIRNIGIIAHIDAGKTTTSERILFYTGKSYKIGDIDEGNTQMDWMEQEKERGITIVSAATTTFWTPQLPKSLLTDQYRINLIDTPGHVDFTAEVERSLRVLDGGVTVLDAEEGVQSQSETVWRQADKYKVPRICFVNKMDKMGADFKHTLHDVEEKLGAKTAIVTYPIGAENTFKGVVMLLEEQSVIWAGDETGAKYNVGEIPADMVEEIAKERSHLIEQICETDDALLEKYLDGVVPSLIELKKALRAATIAYKLVPMYCGTSLRNKGVQPLLDGVVDYLPSPLDVHPAEGKIPGTDEVVIRKPDVNDPFAGLSFKIQADPHIGKLTYLRIYSGKITSGSYIYNATRDKTERVGRLVLMHANDREEVPFAEAGEIVGVVGMKDTRTGDTLCVSEHPIILEGITFAEPVISLSIEPKTKADQEKMGMALARLAEEDPTFKIRTNGETGQTLIAGMGELHLEIIVDRMKREFGVDANVGNPQVAYRETITKDASAEGKYIKQTGGHGQYGHCYLRIKPLARGEGVKFVNAIVGGVIPKEFIAPVEKGVREALENGVIAGFNLVDIEITLYDGSFHDVDSSEIAFKIAGSMAVQSAVRQATPIILEPIMKLEITTPEEFMGDVIGDISSKRGQVLSTSQRGNVRVINAIIPLSELSRYVTILRSMTQGRASSYMEMSHYDSVPSNIAEKIINKENK